jgi:hypothetical protein
LQDPPLLQYPPSAFGPLFAVLVGGGGGGGGILASWHEKVFCGVVQVLE